MQKKLIALAVAGVFAAPAFAATSNVDIFGKVGVEMSYTSNGKPGTRDFGGYTDTVTGSERDFNVDSSQNTELGMKGSEDLGGGLSAVWQIAVDVRIDGVGDNFAPRNTFVGLKSKSLGEVRIGKHDTPYKMSTGKLDLFTGTIADYNTLIGTSGFNLASNTTGRTSVTASTGSAVYVAQAFGFTGTSTSNTQFDARPNNVVAYLSPDFSGFSFAGAYVAMNEDTVDDQTSRKTTEGQAYSLSASYTNGPIFVTGAYEKQKASKSNAGGLNNVTGYGSGDNPAEQAAWKLGVGLTFGTLKLNGLYERLTDNVSGCDVSVNYTGATLGVERDTCSHERNAWMLGAAYGIGAVTLKAQYTHMGDMDQQNRTGAKQWTVGADYALSKRTTVYALYTKLTNEEHAAYSLGQGGTSSPTNVLSNDRGQDGFPGACGGDGMGSGGSNIGLCDLHGGADPDAFAVGIVHTF